jgi:hypothetical protein
LGELSRGVDLIWHEGAEIVEAVVDLQVPPKGCGDYRRRHRRRRRRLLPQ